MPRPRAAARGRAPPPGSHSPISRNTVNLALRLHAPARRVRKMVNAGKRWSLVLVGLLPLGCETAIPPSEPVASPPTPLATQFDAASASTLRGRVTWDGELPQAPPFTTRPHALAGLGIRERLIRENPNAPQIDPTSRGVAHAVVYLRGID